MKTQRSQSMKRLMFLSMMFIFALLLVACKSDEYKEEAGLYEAYFASGDIQLSNFEYYTIELKANGDLVTKSKSALNSQEYEASATFEIEDGKIIVVTKNGSQKVTETYDYIDGEIHMTDVEIQGLSFTIKFRRNQE
jgi:major membrane immunogen (membrane-anchored lipoprotein)